MGNEGFGKTVECRVLISENRIRSEYNIRMPGIDIAGFLGILSVAIIPVLFAVTLHEVAHGWVAMKLGDRTAELAGRLTVNPIKHVDPMGTVVVPMVLALLTPFIFGWAKPVPVVFHNLRQPRRDMVLVAVAGPVANLLMALGWAFISGLMSSLSMTAGGFSGWITGMCLFGIHINVILAVFNMLPIPPLDGGRVLAGLLPPRNALLLHRIEPFGFMIVIGLMFTGLLWTFIDPFRFFFLDFFFSVAGIA